MTEKRIDLGHERGGMYYLDDKVSLTGLIADQPDPILPWHWRLGHSSLQKLQYVIPIESFISTIGHESCELGKHHCASFRVESITTIVLHLS